MHKQRNTMHNVIHKKKSFIFEPCLLSASWHIQFPKRLQLAVHLKHTPTSTDCL